MFKNFGMKGSHGYGETTYTYLGLLFAIIFGFFLREWGITYGLPFIYHQDEAFEVYRALRLGMGDWEYTIFGERIVKSGYYYILFVEYGFYYLFLLATGAINSPIEFGNSILRDPTPIWVIGRTTTAIIGTINIYFIFLLGRQVHSQIVGLLSAILLSGAYLHVQNSHYITVDVPMTCLVTIALYYCVRISNSGSNGDYLKAGIFCGLAALFKLPGIMVLGVVFIAHGFRVRGMGVPPFLRFCNKSILKCFIAFGVVYCVGNPLILLYGPEVIGGLFSQLFGGGGNSSTLFDVHEEVNTWWFYLSSLRTGIGLPLLLCGITGAVKVFIGRSKSGSLLSIFCIIMYVVMSLSSDPSHVFGRYVLPIIPPLIILGCIFVVELIEGITWKNYQKVTICISVVGIMAVSNIWDSVKFDIRQIKTDTRTLAREWIGKNISAGTKILLEGNTEEASQLVVPLDNLKENILALAKDKEKNNPGKALYLKLRGNMEYGPTYDLINVRQFDPFESWVKYKTNGVKVVIVKGYKNGRKGTDRYKGKVVSSRIKLVNDLVRDSDVDRVAVFDPRRSGSPGPYIRVFQVLD